MPLRVGSIVVVVSTDHLESLKCSFTTTSFLGRPCRLSYRVKEELNDDGGRDEWEPGGSVYYTLVTSQTRNSLPDCYLSQLLLPA